MISEALSCQCPVYVYDLFGVESSLFPSKRLRLFLDNLVHRGWIVRFQGNWSIPSVSCLPCDNAATHFLPPLIALLGRNCIGG